MSIAFERFIKEYNAKSTEKLDGYSLENLKGLLPSERSQVIDVLRLEASSFFQAIEALAFLDEKVALATLLDLEENGSPEWKERAYPVHFWLWKLTFEETYAEKFVACRENLSESSVVPFYVLASSGVNSPTLEKLLRNGILNEPDKTAVSVSAKAIIERYGVTKEKNKSRYTELWLTLYEGSITEKQAVLDSLY